MHLSSLALTLASCVAAQGTYILPYGSLPVTPCPSGAHVVAVSGQGSKNVGGYGLLSTLVTDIINRIPGSDNVTLPYNKGESNEIDKINVGTQNLLTYIPDFANQCPDTPIVLAGYSSGGIITMSTLCGGFAPWAVTDPLDSSYASSIIATITYGEETRAADQIYDEGTCSNSAPNTPRTNTEACAPFAGDIQSYCDTQDPQCCADGTNQQQHFAYPSEYDDTASQYVQNKYYDHSP